MIIATLDTYTTLVDPLWTRSPRGIVEAVTPLTTESAAVTIRTNRAWAGHDGGQHVVLGVDVAGVRRHRTYSLTSAASAPGRTLVELGIRRVDGGTLSTVLTDRRAVGTVVHLGAAVGTGVTVLTRPLLLVSAGSGITPTIGILRSLAAAARAGHVPAHDVVVVHHAPTPELTMYRDELTALADAHPWLTVHVRYTRSGDERVRPSDAGDLCADWAERDVRVCGPSGLVDAWQRRWTTNGLAERFHADPFTAADPAPPTSLAGRVRRVAASFGRSAVTVETDTRTTLLDAAEAAGVPAPSGCRRGICHTCTTRLDAGCTTDVRDGRTSTAGSHVQLCVSTAATDVQLDV